jgi:superfamily II RNA helicase
MVRICEYKYPETNEDRYKEYYKQYSYELHDFQKWCVEATVTGNHVLICCPTGSGKTFGGEFAINYFYSKGKKVIYCSPIKALSNEKFYSFTHKYPHISIGLITGDIKTNPDANVLIMTTEILLNKLYQIKSKHKISNSSVSFDMDIENELGCVVFDEIHMINDESRGHVWEQSIMMLPTNIQIVGLSATLDNPEKFALWLETKGDINKQIEKEVFLTRKLTRSVPLLHYAFLTSTEYVYKVIKDKKIQEDIRNNTNKPILIQNHNNIFNEVSYNNISSILKLYKKNDITMKRQHTLNKVAEYLVQNEMLPALCYVFSRKKLEKCAEEMTANLLEFDSKVPYIIDRECEQIIRKLPNYEEYLHLPEYINTVKLLRKGVGIHHAGLMPILREMVELLFAKGYIKILFCTETMSVGINLPVKTTIFTDIVKFNGENMRTLYSHEYTQAAGRAGRLGLDTVGHVIHLNNLFQHVDSVSYKQMMNGKPQILVSKFKISYNLILNLLETGDHNLVEFVRRSMITGDLNAQLNEINSKKRTLTQDMEKIQCYLSCLKTPVSEIENYIELIERKKTLVNKKKREAERSIENLKDTYKTIDNDMNTYIRIKERKNELDILENESNNINNYSNSSVLKVTKLLEEDGFIERKMNETSETHIVLTLKGRIACQLKEVHCLVFANLLDLNVFDNLSAEEITCIFSCFTNISVEDEKKGYKIDSDNKNITDIVDRINNSYLEYQRRENINNIDTGFNYEFHYDLIKYVSSWFHAENIEECKLVLHELSFEKGVFLGEFVKALLKINNITNEFETIAEMTGNMQLLSKLREIPHKTLKYVVTNQSLYI